MGMAKRYLCMAVVDMIAGCAVTLICGDYLHWRTWICAGISVALMVLYAYHILRALYCLGDDDEDDEEDDSMVIENVPEFRRSWLFESGTDIDRAIIMCPNCRVLYGIGEDKEFPDACPVCGQEIVDGKMRMD